MRMFVAIPLPFELQNRLDSWWEEQLRHFPDWRTMPQTNRHLTLHFLGEISGRHQGGVSDALADLFAETPPLALTTRGMGFFPKASRARAFWVGVHGQSNEDSGELKRCARRCQHVCQPFQEKNPGKATPFRGHITMARHSEQVHAGDLMESIAEPPRFEWVADEVHLISSQLRPQGAHYQTVESFDLTG